MDAGLPPVHLRRAAGPGPAGGDVVSMAARRWSCPECGQRITAWADDQDTADAACVQQVRQHVVRAHAATAHMVNAHAQVAGWLSAAGHLVTLWGGPEDGAQLWLPPGQLPAAIGVVRLAAGLEVIRSVTVRRLPGVHTYRCGGTVDAPRYLYDGRPR